MKDLIIIGAGGMGRTMYDLARESLGYGIEFQIKGFIDDKISALNGFVGYPPMSERSQLITQKRMMSLLVQ